MKEKQKKVVTKKKKKVSPQAMQTYCLLYKDANGVLQAEVYAKKPGLKKRLAEMERDSVRYIFKGRPLPFREQITV